jgi:hypothetical protein
MPSDFLEKKLEDLIFENRKSISSRGLDIFYPNAVRQLRIPEGLILDIFTWEIRDEILYGRIIELKREDIDERAYWQSINYWISLRIAVCGYFKDSEIEIVLIGTGSTINVRNAQHTSRIIRLFNYKYTFDGIVFEEITNNIDDVNKTLKTLLKDEENISLASILNNTANPGQ